MINDNIVEPINFNNEKDFNTAIEQLMEITKDNKPDWKVRETAIKKFEKILLGNYGNSLIFVRLFNQKLYLNFSIQMQDLRSSLMKEACRVFCICVKSLKDKLEPAVEKVLSPLVLFKLIGSANKVISDTGAACTSEIIESMGDSVKVITRLCEQARNKNISIRQRISQYMLFIVESYSKQCLCKVLPQVEEFITAMTHDANAEVRSYARKVYVKFLALFPTNANKIFEQFETNVQKAILEKINRNIESTTNSQLNFSDNLSFNNTANSNLSSNKLFDLSNEEEIFNRKVKSPKKQSFNLTNNLTNINNNSNIGSASNSPKKSVKNKTLISKTLYQNLEDQLKEYISNANDPELASKLNSFENIALLFNEIYSNIDFISKQTLKNLVNTHIVHLSHSYPKLACQVMKNLVKFIFYLDDIFTPENINKITKIVTINISSSEETISQNANALFEVMRKKLEANILIKPLIEIIVTETPYEILDISIDIIAPLVELAVNTLSEQNFLNEFLNKLIKVCLLYNKNDTNIVDKVIDVIESLWNKYPRQLSNAIIDSEYKAYIFDLVESYKKPIAKQLKTEISELERTRFKSITDKEKIESLLNTLSLGKLNDVEVGANADIDYEAILSLAVDYNKFLNYILQDEAGNIGQFIVSLGELKHDRIASVLSTLYMFVQNNAFILQDHTGRIIKQLLMLLERFPEHNDTIRKIITMCININKELFLLSIFSYLEEDKQTNPQIIQIILTFIQNTVAGCDCETILLLLPNFIESIFMTLNHNISDVRKLGVYCIVEIYFKIGHDFDGYLNNLNHSQRNLINIYIQKKKDNYI
jgi:hypothetical protein